MVFAHIRLVGVPGGWGTDDSAQACLSEAIRIISAERTYSPGMQKVKDVFPYGDVDRVSAAGSRDGPLSGTDEGRGRAAAVAAGLSRLTFHAVNHPIAISDTTSPNGSSTRTAASGRMRAKEGPLSGLSVALKT